jgi:hypothetical protein
VCLQGEPTSLDVPGNQTSVTLNSADYNALFALSANSPYGSTGQNKGWLCKYLYGASLAKSPQLLESAENHIADDSIIVQWIPVTCDSENQARVMFYLLSYEDLNTG